MADDVWNRAREAAKDRGESLSDVLRRALKEYAASVET